MILTEEEAKTKWCPFVRYSVHADPSANRWKQSLPADEPHALNPVPCRCIASECMAWRKTGGKVRNHRGQWVDRDEDGTGHWQDVGHCGLAGKP